MDKFGLSEVLPEGTAAALEEAGELLPGDFVTDVVGADQQMFECTWLALDDVLEAVARAPAPVTLKTRRGGPEPWVLARDESGGA